MAAKVLSSVNGSKVIVSSCPAHIVSSRRHSLKNEPEYNIGYSHANKLAGYSARLFCKAK